MSVSQDSYSRVYCPASTTEWSELLTGTGIASPSSIWLLQETSGTLADSGSGGRTASVTGSASYYQSATGWSRKGIKLTDGTTSYIAATIPDVNTTSALLLQCFSLNTLTATRPLNHIGTVSAEHALILSGGKLRGASVGATSDGVQQHVGTLVVVTKFDRANSVLGVYTRHEQIKPTYSAPGANTTLLLAGDGSASADHTLMYAALWSGADAEISDALIQDLLEAVHGAETTLEKLQAGSTTTKWVATIEGCKYIFSDAPAAAVINAYAGTDWNDSSNVHGGLFVQMSNEQSIQPMQTFTRMGSCTLRILDDGTDRFGTYVARRQGGDETTITATVDRNDTTIYVRSTAPFASSGDAFIGTECFAYTGVGGTSFTGCTRGKYSPFKAALSGSGGNRFANHHPVSTDVDGVQLSPVVSSIPRVWLGKRVAVRLHTWDATNQALNSRAEAQLMFAGRIVALSDDHSQVGITTIELEHAMEEFWNTTIGDELWQAEVAEGLSLKANRVFKFSEYVNGSASATSATDLTVKASGASGTNEINAGVYSLSELCEALNRWIGGNKAATTIAGFYSFSSPVSSNEGMRTKLHINLPNASNTGARLRFSAPAEVLAFLGIKSDYAPDPSGMTGQWIIDTRTNTSDIASGDEAPFTTLVFRVYGPAIFGGGFDSDALSYDADNERGEFQDQYASLPACVKTYASTEDANWGLFLLDEKVLIIGYYDSANRRLHSCAIAPYQLAAGSDASGLAYIGRRSDDPSHGPVTIRQVLVQEGGLADRILQMAYSTGVNGYNHATHDTLSAANAVGMPGELLGPEFEASLYNMASSDAARVFVIDEPIKLGDLIKGDLQFLWAFLRWKDQHFEFKQWDTPLNALAVATLSESNKALPAGQDDANHRCASVETNAHTHPVIQVDFARDFGFGRTGEYFKTAIVKDHTAASDAGTGVEPTLIRLRNTFEEFAATGGSIKAGLGEFIARMTTVSKSSREIARTVDHRYFEQLAPGDIVTVEDDFARDPLTGTRGVSSRAGFVTSVDCDIGGPSPDVNGAPRDISGSVTINFLDTQRGKGYAPAGDIDDTAGSGGFSAGYNNGTATIRLYEHHYSHSIVIPLMRGALYDIEGADASNFAAGDKILIVERDPADPASVTSWERTVQSVSGNDITLTATLSSPAWDATKRYRVVPQKYSQVQTSQREVAYQADDTDEMVEDTEIPWHFSSNTETYDFSDNNTATPGEFVADLCYGDGRPWDVGHDAAIAKTINAYVDYKSAHSAPLMWSSVMGPVDETSSKWATFFFGPIFLGTEHLSTTVSRVLRVTPFFRSRTGATGKMRVTIMDTPPSAAAAGGYLPGEQFRETEIIGRYSRSSEWSTTSTTYATGATAELSLSTKDIFMGFVWLLVEGTGYVQTYGLDHVSEGPRVVL